MTACDVRVYDAAGGRIRSSADEVASVVGDLAATSDGEVIAAADVDEVLLWRGGADAPPVRVAGVSAPIAISSDGRRLAGMRGEREIVVMDVAKPQAVVHVFQARGHSAVKPAFAESDGALVLGSMRRRPPDGEASPPDDTPTLQVWDLATGIERPAPRIGGGYAESTFDVAVLPSGDEVLVARSFGWTKVSSKTGRILLEEEAPLPEARAWPSQIDALAVDATTGANALVWREGDERLLRVRDASQGEFRQIAAGPDTIEAVAWIPGGRELVVAGHHGDYGHGANVGIVRILDARTGRVSRSWTCCEVDADDGSDVRICVVTRPDGKRRLLTCGFDAVVKLWALD